MQLLEGQMCLCFLFCAQVLILWESDCVKREFSDN